MVAKDADISVIDDLASGDLPRRYFVYEEVVELVSLPSLMAPETLHLPAMLSPVAVVEVAPSEIVEVSIEPLPAVNLVPVPRGIQVAPDHKAPSANNRGERVGQSQQILLIVGWIDVDTHEESRYPRHCDLGARHVGTGRWQRQLLGGEAVTDNHRSTRVVCAILTPIDLAELSGERSVEQRFLNKGNIRLEFVE